MIFIIENDRVQLKTATWLAVVLSGYQDTLNDMPLMVKQHMIVYICMSMSVT